MMLFDGYGENYNTIELSRNTLYYVTLKKKDVPTEYAPLEASVSVADWREGEAILWSGTNLAQKAEPEIVEITKSVTNDGGLSYDAATSVNSTAISTNAFKSSVGNRQMKLTIKVKTGATGANIECENLTAALGTIDNQSSPELTYDDDGNLYQEWTVSLNASAAKTAKDNGTPLVFKIYNQLDSEKQITLTLSPMEIQQNPLWWVAQYNMKDKTTMYSTHNGSGQNVFKKSGFADVSYANYHLASRYEMTSIVPADRWNNNGSNIFGQGGTVASPKEFLEVESMVGGNNIAASTSLLVNDGTANAYAIRFIGTEYVSAWHYKNITTPYVGLLIESYFVDVNTLDEAKAIIGTVKESTIWSTFPSITANQMPEDSEFTDEGYVQRFLPAAGYTKNGTNDIAPAATTNAGHGVYWSGDYLTTSNGYGWEFTSTNLFSNYDDWTHSFSVRMFRDY